MKQFACFVVLSLSLLGNVSGQEFQDLDFESANLTQYVGSVAISNALPGWIGYIGTNPVMTVLQNDITLGNASIDIIGPDPNDGNLFDISIIEGQYSVVLQQGGFLPYVSASISQSGLVPANAQSLQFRVQAAQNKFAVSLGGQTLSLVPLGSGANYTLYGAAISAFAGKVETLTITAIAGPNIQPYVFDSLVFSPLSIPTVSYTVSPTNGFVPLSVRFDCPSADSGGNAISNWSWNFGDNTTSTNQNPSHVYTTVGRFTPSLLASNSLGLAVAGSGSLITVSPPPAIAGFSLTGTNLVIQGANGLSGTTYYVLMSTNLTLPRSQWTPVATNTWSANGDFNLTVTNAVNLFVPKEFYLLQVP